MVTGPDVWEVVASLRGAGTRQEKKAIAAAAAELAVSQALVLLALDYYGSYPGDIDAQIAENQTAAEQALAAFYTRQRLLA